MKYIIPVFLAAFLTATSAYAVPAAAPATGASSADSGLLIQAKYKYDKKYYKKQYKHYDRHHYHGGRYHGGHYYNHHYRYHYNRRPYDWYRRGCVSVGPIWYCN